MGWGGGGCGGRGGKNVSAGTKPDHHSRNGPPRGAGHEIGRGGAGGARDRGVWAVETRGAAGAARDGGVWAGRSGETRGAAGAARDGGVWAVETLEDLLEH